MKKWKWLWIALAVIVAIAVISVVVASIDDGPEPEPEPTPVKSWKDGLESSLASEIEKAVADIDENEWGNFTVTGVELVRENKTPICTFRYYKLTTHWTFAPTERDEYFVIRTREWNEGEPETAEYPNEYLECVNDWVSEENLTGGTLIWSLAE